MVHLRPEDSSAKRAEAGNGSERFSRGPWRVARVERMETFIDAGDVHDLSKHPNSGCWIAQAMGAKHEANAHLMATAPELYAALTDMFALMDEGYLVRNTSGDGETGWAMTQLPFLKRLQEAHAALAKARGEP